MLLKVELHLPRRHVGAVLQQQCNGTRDVRGGHGCATLEFDALVAVLVRTRDLFPRSKDVHAEPCVGHGPSVVLSSAGCNRDGSSDRPRGHPAGVPRPTLAVPGNGDYGDVVTQEFLYGSLDGPRLLSVEGHVDNGWPVASLCSLEDTVQPLHYCVPRSCQVAVQDSDGKEVHVGGHPVINSTDDSSDVCPVSNTVPPSHVLCVSTETKTTKAPQGLRLVIGRVTPGVLRSSPKLVVREMDTGIQDVHVHPFPGQVAGWPKVGVEGVGELIDSVQSPGIEDPARD